MAKLGRRDGGHVGVLTIRNVDDDVIVALKARAKANHRSLEGELRHLLARHAIPGSTLGAVRERARLAAMYRATPAVPLPAGDVAERAEEAGSDARVGSVEWLGAMSDVGDIVGDIVSPASDPSDWAALHAGTAEPNDAEVP